MTTNANLYKFRRRSVCVGWAMVVVCIIGNSTGVFAGGGDPSQPPRKSDLEARRKVIEAEIKTTSARFAATVAQQKSAAQKAALVERQLANRNNLLANIHAQLDETERGIARTDMLVQSLQTDMEGLRTEYGRILRLAYRYRHSSNDLLFFLSAPSFNEAYRRWQYLKSYNDYRRRQVALIRETQQSLTTRTAELTAQRVEKKHLLTTEQQQQESLRADLASKAALANNLTTKANALRDDIARKNAIREEINRAIEGAIRATIASEKGAVKGSDLAKGGSFKLSAKEAAISETNFASAKGKLPWPIDGATITRRFGNYQQETQRNVTVPNNGIEFRAPASHTPIKAIAGGVVRDAHFIPSINDYFILVEHGAHFTAYSNVSSIKIASGDRVTAGQVLGYTGGKEGRELHFEVWKQTNKDDPAKWLKK